MRCTVVEKGTGPNMGLRTIEVPLNVPASDVPYFVDLQLINDNTLCINLGFSGRRESLRDFQKEHRLLRFGEKTGRVYAMVISMGDENHPWSDHLRHIEKDIAGKQNNRFSRNLILGLLLSEGIISKFLRETPPAHSKGVRLN